MCVSLKSRALERLAHGGDRSDAHDRGIDADRRIRQTRASGDRAKPCRRVGVVTTSAAAPSLMPEALPAVTVPSFLKAGFERGELFDRRSGARILVGVAPAAQVPSSAAPRPAQSPRRTRPARDCAPRRAAGSRRRTRPDPRARRRSARRCLGGDRPCGSRSIAHVSPSAASSRPLRRGPCDSPSARPSADTARWIIDSVPPATIDIRRSPRRSPRRRGRPPAGRSRTRDSRSRRAPRSGRPAFERRLARDVHSGARLQHAAEDDVAELARPPRRRATSLRESRSRRDRRRGHDP